MSARIQEIRERLIAATPVLPPEEWYGYTKYVDGACHPRPLAELFANAPQDLAYLLAEVERLQNALSAPEESEGA